MNLYTNCNDVAMLLGGYKLYDVYVVNISRGYKPKRWGVATGERSYVTGWLATKFDRGR